MTGPVPEVGVREVRAVVQQVWRPGSKHETCDLVLLRGRPRWSGPALVEGLDGPVRVGVAASPMAVLDQLSLHPGERLVVVTDVGEPDLGADLLSRAWRERVVAPDPWGAVALTFRVTRAGAVDPLLVKEGEEVAQVLLDLAPSGGWPAPASGIVTRDHALRSLATHVLGTPRDLDAAGLLEWSRDPAGGLSLRDLPARARDALVRWAVERCGQGAVPVLRLAVAGHGTEALHLGLVIHLALRVAGGGVAKGAVGARLGRPAVPEHALSAWGELCHAWALRQLETNRLAALRVLADADAEAAELQLGSACVESDLLPSGLLARLRECASALTDAATSPGERSLAVLEARWSRARRHSLAAEDPTATSVAMAVRLVRWLAVTEDQPPAAHLEQALRRQVNVGAWVDRARQVVANGVGDGVVAAGLGAVHERATARRAVEDHRAARQLAAAVRNDAAPGSVVPVEEALERLVEPIVQGSELVLLVVLDGMSAAVACELVESVVGRDWVEQQRDPDLGRDVLLAGLPTVTEVSRASLLSGRRTRGGQREERSGLSAALGRETPLFHLGDLVSVPGRDLPLEVHEAVQSGANPVVGVVLNAVDDALSGGDPARTRWTVDAVRHLPALLERARVAGRVVLLTSDHGHVVDRGPDGDVFFQRPGAGARWRPAAEDVRDDEVRLRGSRVQLGDGDVVAAVAETLRYKQRNEGYHGGAALAELAIPFVALARRGWHVAGWAAVPPSAPAWWEGPVELDATGRSDGTLFS